MMYTITHNILTIYFKSYHISSLENMAKPHMQNYAFMFYNAIQNQFQEFSKLISTKHRSKQKQACKEIK
jgi:hypothetical protein